MWQNIYTILTIYQGVYLFYLLPVGAVMALVVGVISSKRRLRQPLGASDIIAAAAIGVIFLDFGNYLYLFFSKTGKLLPPQGLLLKYAGGLLLWLWLCWYSYRNYLFQRLTSAQFKQRCAKLLWIGIGAVLLAVVGIIIS